MLDEYPNSSETWAVEPPEDRKEAEQKEQAKVSTSIGVIQDVLDWFDANAALYASTDALGVDEATPNDQAKLAILHAKKMRLAFQAKSNEFRAEFAKYLQEEPPKQ